MAAIGKQLKQSVKVFHSLMLYLFFIFIIKSISSIDAGTFVVSSKKKKLSGYVLL